MENLLVSVFNEQNRFADTVTIQAGMTFEEVKKALFPHTVTESPTKNVVMVKPMSGLHINENEFYRLVLATLTSAGMVNDPTTFTSGYGAFKITSEIVDTDTSVTLIMTMTEEDVPIFTYRITAEDFSPSHGKSYHEHLVETLLEKTRGMQTLLRSGTEFLTAALYKRKMSLDSLTGEEDESVTPLVKSDSFVWVTLQTFGPVGTSLNIDISVDAADAGVLQSDAFITVLCNELKATFSDGCYYLTSSENVVSKIRQVLSDHGIVPHAVVPRNLQTSVGLPVP